MGGTNELGRLWTLEKYAAPWANLPPRCPVGGKAQSHGGPSACSLVGMEGADSATSDAPRRRPWNGNVPGPMTSRSFINQFKGLLVTSYDPPHVHTYRRIHPFISVQGSSNDPSGVRKRLKKWFTHAPQMPVSDRHSGLGRSATGPQPQHYQHSKHQEHHAGAGMTDDQAEALAEKIIDVGGGYLVAKTEAKYTPEEVPSGIGAVAAGPDAEALAKKIIKEAAREMERAQGIVVAGSDAALAQSVLHHIDDPSAPEHKVFRKVVERLQGAEGHARHHTFQSPNPDLGSEPSNARVRHLKGNLNTDFVTTGFRDEKNPDVKPPRH